ncbi:MAG: YdgA family protein [Pseudomonas sp.]|uniref:YdgA family protein n=1 Tax=Pseudomonas sp. TaxID=306 RepID=UPI0039822C82
MKKIALSALGVVAVLGALSTAGAWYTGQQLPAVLDTSIQQANQSMAKTLPAAGFTATLELLSLERQLFSSDARYRIQVVGSFDGESPSTFEWTVADHIEHGPLPLSRLKAFKLLPVMATSNYQLERSPQLEKWFAGSQDGAPLQGQVSLGYDRSMSGNLQLQPLQVALDEQTNIDFSGLKIDFDASANAEQIAATGMMDSFKVSSTLASDEDMRIELKGMSLNSNTRKGSSEFYLGRNEVRMQVIELQVGEAAPILFKDFVQHDETSETNQQLAARYGYDVGMISYQGQDIGSSHMQWNVTNLDAAALQSMITLYGTLLQNGQVDSESGMPQLSDEQAAQFKADLEKLLAGKPSLALENLSFKTANGESSFNFALDLDKPASFDLPAPELVKQLIAQLEVKLQVSKAMISDVVGIQAALAGETDKEAIAQQASMMAEMASGIAVASELASADAENISSSLQYANDQVTFNGKQMTVEQFVALLMSSGGGLAGMGQ